jgi:hypothetical protein
MSGFSIVAPAEAGAATGQGATYSLAAPASAGATLPGRAAQ